MFFWKFEIYCLKNVAFLRPLSLIMAVFIFSQSGLLETLTELLVWLIYIKGKFCHRRRVCWGGRSFFPQPSASMIKKWRRQSNATKPHIPNKKKKKKKKPLTRSSCCESVRKTDIRKQQGALMWGSFFSFLFSFFFEKCGSSIWKTNACDSPATGLESQHVLWQLALTSTRQSLGNCLHGAGRRRAQKALSYS